MSSVGPQLPAELQQRKRRHDEGDDDSDSSDSSTGPLPPHQQEKEQSPPTTKRKRVIGPTLPPAPLDERPSEPPQPAQEDDEGKTNTSDEDDDDDDGFGPSLPPAHGTATGANSNSSGSIDPQGSGGYGMAPTAPAPAPAKRDEWMTLAPTGGDWSARVDPTKLKNRKFNTGRGAKGPPQTTGSGAGGQSWYETPEEKQARLKREVMGIQDTVGGGAGGVAPGSTAGYDSQEEATARRLKEYNQKRGPSLYTAHSATTKGDEDDDPSARAFDREKDIAGGATINATKRREMLKKASDFSSRFSSAKYL